MMKTMIALLLLLLLLLLLSSHLRAQDMSLDAWNEQAKTNIRLQPKFGGLKNAQQLSEDQKYTQTVFAQYGDIHAAANYLIDLGFSDLNKDVKTAMYRFNQAYLLDSTNADIYWGFGAVYFALGDLEKAQTMYQNGLAIAPNNTHLLTDYATYCLSQYIGLASFDVQKANTHLDTAINYLQRSYALDNQDPNTCIKLSTCYLYKNDCKQARRFYNAGIALDEQANDDTYLQSINKHCQ